MTMFRTFTLLFVALATGCEIQRDECCEQDKEESKVQVKREQDERRVQVKREQDERRAAQEKDKARAAQDAPRGREDAQRMEATAKDLKVALERTRKELEGERMESKELRAGLERAKKELQDSRARHEKELLAVRQKLEAIAADAQKLRSAQNQAPQGGRAFAPPSMVATPVAPPVPSMIGVAKPPTPGKAPATAAPHDGSIVIHCDHGTVIINLGGDHKGPPQIQVHDGKPLPQTLKSALNPPVRVLEVAPQKSLPPGKYDVYPGQPVRPAPTAPKKRTGREESEEEDEEDEQPRAREPLAPRRPQAPAGAKRVGLRVV
jgi:hypothetical protein